MESEKRTVNTLLEVLRPSGDVLQIGYHSGYAVDEIQKYRPASHLIIETDPLLIQEEESRIQKYPRLKIIQGRWEDAISHLGMFDAIFYSSAEQSEREEQCHVVEEGDQLLREISEQLPHMKKIRYSDRELDAFCKNAAASFGKELSRFLDELTHNGQIDPEQKERMIHKYKLKKESFKKIQSPFAKPSERLYLFLKECLASHMRKEGRICCYLADPSLKDGDPRILHEIVVDPLLNYREITLPSSKSAQHSQPLILFIEKSVQ